MSEFTRERHRAARTAGHPRASVLWLGAVALAATAACAASKPPPRAAEVPIDQFQATSGPAPAGDPVSSSTVVEPAVVPISPSPAGGVAPTQLPASNAAATAAPLPPYPAPGTHGRPSHAQRLAAADCARLSDRYFLAVGVSQGLTVAQATKAARGLKAQARLDASYAAGEASCVSQNTRRQYQCAMKATNPSTWKSCLE
jgi:hypothetical protein